MTSERVLIARQKASEIYERIVRGTELMNYSSFWIGAKYYRFTDSWLFEYDSEEGLMFYWDISREKAEAFRNCHCERELRAVFREVKKEADK